MVDSKLLKIEKNQFLALMKEYPNIKEEIREIISIREDEIMKIKEEED